MPGPAGAGSVGGGGVEPVLGWLLVAQVGLGFADGVLVPFGHGPAEEVMLLGLLGAKVVVGVAQALVAGLLGEGFLVPLGLVDQRFREVLWAYLGLALLQMLEESRLPVQVALLLPFGGRLFAPALAHLLVCFAFVLPEGLVAAQELRRYYV